MSRPCRRRRPSSLDDGGISGLFSSGGPSVRFLTRYDGEFSGPRGASEEERGPSRVTHEEERGCRPGGAPGREHGRAARRTPRRGTRPAPGGPARTPGLAAQSRPTAKHSERTLERFSRARAGGGAGKKRGDFCPRVHYHGTWRKQQHDKDSHQQPDPRHLPVLLRLTVIASLGCRY